MEKKRSLVNGRWNIVFELDRKKPVKLETWRQLKDTQQKLFYQNENKMKVEEYAWLRLFLLSLASFSVSKAGTISFN